MDWSHISAQSALYELWLHLFPLTWPWEFNFLVSPQALFSSASPHTEFFQLGFCHHFDLIFTPHVYNSSNHIVKNMHFTFTLIVQTVTHKFHSQPQKLSEQNCSFWSSLRHLPPLFAVHLLVVVSMDVEWCPNPLKAHVGTVCISFSHLGERPQPSLFTGIPCPLSVQPQPTALA